MATGLPSDKSVISGCRTGTDLFLYIDVPNAIRDGFEFRRSGNNVIQTPGINGVLPFKYILGGADKDGHVVFGTIPRSWVAIKAPWRRPETRAELKARSNELKARLLPNSGQCKRKEAPADEIKAKVLKTTHTLVVEHERRRLTGLAAQRKAVYVMVLLAVLYGQSSSMHRALLNGLAAQRQAVYVLVPSSTNSYLHRVVINSTKGRPGPGRQISPVGF